jgi:hypothetical protein
MKKICWLLVAFLAIAASLHFQVACTASSQVAGGSGAGNPGGVATIALLVDTQSSAGLSKISATSASDTTGKGAGQAGGPVPASSNDQIAAAGKGPFTITDDGGMSMTVTGTTIAVKAVYFMLDSGQNPAKLLERFDQPLLADSSSIVLNGPFVFDAMTGVSVPSIDTLKLPEARYTGIKLLLDTAQHGGQPGGRTGSAVDITGTFVYQAVQRNFSFRLNMNQAIPYMNAQSSVVVQAVDTTNFTIVFNPQLWLSGVNIASCIDNGYITLENSGDLIIDGNTGRGPCQSIEGAIRQNVVASGQLRVRAR